MPRTHILLFATLFLAACSFQETINPGQTEITKWQHGKTTAITLTYDDGTINQFTKALPIMNQLGFPATFYIITGKIKGSAQGKFIGRDIDAIIQETATIPTDKDNLFERASAIGYSGFEGARQYHTDAGSRVDSEDMEEAFELIDEGYRKIRNNQLEPTDTVFHDNETDTTTWEDIKAYTAQGHEFGSHTITHPRLAILDEANLLYELEKSKEDIRNFLGDEHTFSAECPYGTENERVMDYAYEIYPALRNRMPEPFLEELNRGSDLDPGDSEKEYVQWQRGPLTDISMETMKSWVDTCLVHQNIWLVLVFHGVDGIGWEPRTGSELEEYFSYIKEREDQIWVATFADVTKYIRERQNATVNAAIEDDTIEVTLTHKLDQSLYDLPLTLKTYIPDTWQKVQASLGNGTKADLYIHEDQNGRFVYYQMKPGSEPAKLVNLN